MHPPPAPEYGQTGMYGQTGLTRQKCFKYMVYIYHLFEMLKPAVVETTEKLWKIYREGAYSVRGLAKKYGIPFTTLRDRFRIMYGKEYTDYRSGEGTTYALVIEHLNSLTGRDRERAMRWFRENKQNLLDRSHQERERPPVYTSKRMNSDTQSHCRLPFDLRNSPFLCYEDEDIA